MIGYNKFTVTTMFDYDLGFDMPFHSLHFAPAVDYIFHQGLSKPQTKMLFLLYQTGALTDTRTHNAQLPICHSPRMATFLSWGENLTGTTTFVLHKVGL